MTTILDTHSHLIMCDPNSGCWLWTGFVMKKGYGQLRIQSGTVNAHRHSWILTNGPVKDGLWVLHKCNVAGCVNPDHVYLGTHTDNMRDMKSSGRRKGKNSGVKSGCTHLTDSDVLSIRLRVSAGELRAKIAQEFGLSKGGVAHIVQGRTWSHLH